MAVRNETMLVVDFNGGLIIECRASNGGAGISRSWRLPDGCADDLLLKSEMSAARFASFCSEAGVPRRLPTVAVLPARLEIIRNFSLPPSSGAELDSMVEFEANERLPYPSDIWQWAYRAAERSEAPGKDVTMHAARRDAIDNCAAAIKEAGFILERIYSWTMCAASLPVLQSAGTSSTLVAPSGQDIALALVSGAGINTLRTFNARDTGPLPMEFSLAMDEFEASGKSNKIIILGAEVSSPTVFAALRNGFGAVEAIGWKELNEAGINIAPECGDDVAPASGAIAAAAVKLFNSGECEDLIPRAPRAELNRLRRKFAATAAAALLVIAFAAAAFGAVSKSNSYNRKAAALEAHIKAMTPRVEKVNAIRARLSVYENSAGAGRSPLDVMKELSLIVPAGDMKITRLYYEKEGKIGISGQAKTHEQVTALISKMGSSRVFSEAHLDFSRSSEEFSKPVVSFEISAKLSSEDER